MFVILQPKYQLMFVICLGLGILLLCTEVDARKRDGSDEDSSGEYRNKWGKWGKWDKNKDKDKENKNKKFICPFPHGAFPDAKDCLSFYMCTDGVAKHTRCPAWKKFDKHRKTCLSVFVAVCDNGMSDETTTVKQEKTTTVKASKFQCPSFRGSYSHPEDCTKYYTCSFFIPSLRTCPENQLFDVVKTECKPANEVHCGSRIRTTRMSDETTTVKQEKTTTVKASKFECPSFRGSYSHPEDCTKYYTCSFFFPSLRTCLENQLFDVVKKECKPANEVHCGSRTRPTTIAPSTEPTSPNPTTLELTTPSPRTTSAPTTTLGTTTPSPRTTSAPTTTLGTTTPNPTTTLGTTTPNPTTTPEPTTVLELTTPSPATTPEQTTIIEPTTTVLTTTLKLSTSKPTTTPELTTTVELSSPKPTGPPETDCAEDDLDCIIKETGKVTDWFQCPDGIGSYRHPSSKKLFIFCINRKPFVKRCGQDMIFSDELRTCVNA